MLTFTAGRRWWWWQRLALLAAYSVGVAVGLLNATDLDHPLAVRPPYREVAGIPGPVLGWGWIGFRALVLGMSVWWAGRAWHREGRAGARRGQLGAVLAMVVCGTAGAVVMILSRQLGGPDWPGTALIAVALALAAYAVVVQRAFVPPDVARRSLYYLVGSGLLIAAYVAFFLGLERLSRRVLAVDASLVTALAFVLTIALFDPAREWVYARLDRRSEGRDRAGRLLLRAMGDQLFTSQRPDTAIGQALAQLCGTLQIGAATVVTPDGRTIATYGADQPLDDVAALRLPLCIGQREVGWVSFGSKLTHQPYTEAETDLLGHAAAFMAASLQLAERQTEQALALETLSQERTAVQAQASALAEAVASAESAPAASAGLHVYALGPLRVERGGERIRRWGGTKAGTRQAEAVFAFLFDRGERGVAKDEFLEVIWPDVDLDKADHSFHRTLGGLRRILEPDGRYGGAATAIVYHNDRYRLDLSLIAWSDVAAFQERLAAAHAAGEPAAAIAALEEARALYRGEYLDDCPFYGDSEYVDERRTLLRGRYVDVLLALGEHYEARGDLPAAAACYRQALQTAGNDCPRAEDALVRLRLPA